MDLNSTNYAFCSLGTQAEISALLESPAVRDSVKTAIIAGLKRDCLDADRDAHLVAEILHRVCDDILNR